MGPQAASSRRRRGASAAISLYLLAGALVIGCDRTSRTNPGRSLLKEGAPIIVVSPHADDPRWPGIRGGVLRYAKAVPTIRVECVVPPQDTPDSLRATLTAVLKKQPAAVCLYVTESDAREPTALRANLDRIARAQAVLITIGWSFDDKRVYGHVGVNLPEAAELLGRELARIAAPRHAYLLIHRDGASPLSTNCYQRFTSAARSQAGLTLLQDENLADRSRSPAQVVEDLLGLYPSAGLLVTIEPDVWLTAPAGWVRKLRSLNRDFHFATLSAAPPLWGQLGTVATPGDAAALAGPLDGDLGYAAVELAVQALTSEREPMPVRWIPCELVTAENLPDFARRYSVAAGGLDVSRYLGGTVTIAAPPGGP